MGKWEMPDWFKDKLAEKIAESGASSHPFHLIESQKHLADLANKAPGDLTGIDCPLCLNRGYFTRVSKDGYRYNEECSCMKKRRSLERIKRSGLSGLIDRYTFEAWQIKSDWQAAALSATLEYAQNPRGWLVVSGRPGTGKTHLCTAACKKLIDSDLEVLYLLWRDFSVRAKAVVNEDEEYQRLVAPAKRISVLYIDDLFKTGKGQEPTAGDINLAFEILNSRYNSNLPTIISSELTIEMMMDLDEGVGSRIFERAKGNYIDLSERKNWRLG